MNLIEKLGLEKCKAIVDVAPDWAVSVNLHNGMYYDLREVSRGDLWLMDLRTAIANHGTPTNEGTDNLSHFDHCSDIANHISPNTKVIER